MPSNFRHRMHPRGVLFNTIESTFLSTGALLIAIVTLVILFLGIYLRLV